ncbi:MAG: SBBP repeat-containing protein [Bacteroidetes bacterium]|nr:SBBP repeat-containing protein [Bacteroidota bacterium]
MIFGAFACPIEAPALLLDIMYLEKAPFVKNLTLMASSGSFIAKFDPTGVLIWSTYFNGGSDVACDATNNIFLCGASSGVPVMAAFQPAPAGGGDCFITKFSSGGVMQWSTYFGGTGNDQGIGITCDTFGNVFFTGLTSSTNFPTLSPFQAGLNGGTDSFVVKLNPATGFPVWSTYYGGNLTEGTNVDAAIAADNFGNVIITGSTNSTTGISTAGSFQPGNSSTGFSEGYVAKFSSTGNLLWATYLGGSGYEEPRGIATDNKNNIIVSGDTYSTNFPITSCAFQKSFLGTEDQFITTFDPNGKLICSGFLGAGNSSSTHNETIDGCGGIVAVDGCFVYLIASSWCIYPVTPNAYQFNCGGVWDATFAQLYVNTCGGVTSMINFSGNSTLCAGNTINFTSSYIGCDKTGITYLWTFPGGTPSTSTAVNPTGIAYNTPGTYPVKLVIQQPCGSDSLEKLNFITVNNCGCTMSASNAITTNVSCNGGNTGSATANVSGGTAPYTYLWSSGQTTQVVTGLTMGTYTVTATDSKGCTQPQVISIIQPEPINLNLSGTNVSCTSSGSASVFVLNGGSPPYIYSWSTGQTTASISGIPAGNYTVTVADGNGCKIVKAYTVTGTSPVSASFTASSACKGSVVNFTNTGTAPGSGVTYNWVISPISPANVSGTTTDFSYTFLSTGIYNVSHTVNSGGCSSNIVITITVVNCTAGPIVTTTANSVCPGYCATVTSIATGGASPYTYAWSNGSTTQNISPCPVSTTTYTVTIRDVGGNSATSTALVTINPSVTATITQTNLTCAGSNNGSAQAIGAGGSPVYSFSWSNGAAASLISNLSSQAYTVTITDSKGCTSISTTTIVSPPVLAGQFAKGTANCAGCGCKEWLMVNATGGTSPYSYTWPDGYVNRYKNQLCPGSYTINVKDKNGCSANLIVNAP